MMTTNKTLRRAYSGSVLFVLAFILLANCAADEKPATATPQAVIWYLGHCGYAVQTDNHFLIFDYIELEESPTERGLDAGFIDPAEIADRRVTVFVTHSHIDHYDEIVHGWKDQVENIQYVFGWSVEEGPNLHVMTGRRAKLELDGMTVHSVDSHHAGVTEAAYLVKVDGLCLFHAGDYQGRPGRGRPSRAVEDMRHLMAQTEVVDLLFIGAWLGGPYPDIIKGLAPRVIFPMHNRKREELYRLFAEDVRELGLNQPVVCPVQRGDRFVYRQGTVE